MTLFLNTNQVQVICVAMTMFWQYQVYFFTILPLCWLVLPPTAWWKADPLPPVKLSLVNSVSFFFNVFTCFGRSTSENYKHKIPAADSRGKHIPGNEM